MVIAADSIRLCIHSCLISRLRNAINSVNSEIMSRYCRSRSFKVIEGHLSWYYSRPWLVVLHRRCMLEDGFYCRSPGTEFWRHLDKLRKITTAVTTRALLTEQPTSKRRRQTDTQTHRDGRRGEQAGVVLWGRFPSIRNAVLKPWQNEERSRHTTQYLLGVISLRSLVHYTSSAGPSY